MRTRQESSHLHAKERGLKVINPAYTLISDFQSQELKVRNKCLLLKPLSLWHSFPFRDLPKVAQIELKPKLVGLP